MIFWFFAYSQYASRIWGRRREDVEADNQFHGEIQPKFSSCLSSKVIEKATHILRPIRIDHRVELL